MVKVKVENSYEEARKKRVLENLKQLEVISQTDSICFKIQKISDLSPYFTLKEEEEEEEYSVDPSCISADFATHLVFKCCFGIDF